MDAGIIDDRRPRATLETNDSPPPRPVHAGKVNKSHSYACAIRLQLGVHQPPEALSLIKVGPLRRPVSGSYDKPDTNAFRPGGPQTPVHGPRPVLLLLETSWRQATGGHGPNDPSHDARRGSGHVCDDVLAQTRLLEGSRATPVLSVGRDPGQLHHPVLRRPPQPCGVRSATYAGVLRSVVSTKSAREGLERVMTWAFSQHQVSTGKSTAPPNRARIAQLGHRPSRALRGPQRGPGTASMVTTRTPTPRTMVSHHIRP